MHSELKDLKYTHYFRLTRDDCVQECNTQTTITAKW